MQQPVHLEIPDFPNKFSNICFIAQSDSSHYNILKLKQNVQSLKQASYSPFMTLGAYLLFHHPHAQPPRFQCHQKTNGKVDATYPSKQLTLNQYHELWNDYLSNLVPEGKIYQLSNTIYMADFVDQTYLEAFQESDIFENFQVSKQQLQHSLDSNDFVAIIQSIYHLEKVSIPKKRKFAAVCMASRAPVTDRYLPRVHIQAMFYGIFYRQQDQWTSYKPVSGRFPTQTELQSFDAVVLSGSSYSVYEDIPEINQFMAMLKQAYHKNPKLKILGFCFGHQSIAYVFGGKVQAMKQVVVKLENINFDSEQIQKFNFPWFKKQSEFLSGKKPYLLSEYHGDQVFKLPQGFTIIGSSDSCPNQAMVSNDGRCLSFQFHMEYTPEFGGAFELRVKNYDPQLKYATIYDGSTKLRNSQRNVDSVFELRDISRRFLQS